MVSVILATYNGARSLRDAVTSILGQSYQDTELLIVDDCSTEPQAVAMVEELADLDDRIKIIRSSNNSGAAGARNLALQQASGEFVALMDDDDLSDRERLRLQLDFLLANQDCAAVSCKSLPVRPKRFRHCASGGGKIISRGPGNNSDLSALIGCLVNSTSVIRTKALHAIGGWRALFRSAEDMDLTLRLEEKHHIARLPQVLYRIAHIDRSNNHAAAHGNAWQYRLAAVISAAFRRDGQADPMESAADVGQMLAQCQQVPAPYKLHLWRCIIGDARRHLKRRRYDMIDEQLRTLSLLCGTCKEPSRLLLQRLSWYALSTLRPGWFVHRLRHAN